MKHRILVAAAAVMALSLAAPSRADDTSRLALAHQVVSLMNVDHVIDDMFQQLSPMLAVQAGQEMRLTPSEQQRLGQILAEEFHNSIPQVMDSVASVYSRNVSEEQLAQIRDFLQSPAGQAMISTQGAMQQELRREGENIGMQVAARALQRFAAERQSGAIH